MTTNSPRPPDNAKARPKETSRSGGYRFLRNPVTPPVPNPVQSWECKYFRSDNIRDLVQAAQVRSIPEKFGASAELLNEGVTLYAAHLQYGNPSRPGSVEKWAGEVKNYADSLLFALGINANGPERPLPDGVVHLLAQGLAEGEEDIFRSREKLRKSAAVIREISRAASQVSKSASIRKRSGQRNNMARRALFLFTTEAYLVATGRPPMFSRSADYGVPGGPCIRFHREAFRYLLSCLTPDEPDLGHALCFSDENMATAIADVRNIGK